jgi:hypothetical protein
MENRPTSFHFHTYVARDYSANKTISRTRLLR